jgi:hypothetical protein
MSSSLRELPGPSPAAVLHKILSEAELWRVAGLFRAKLAVVDRWRFGEQLSSFSFCCPSVDLYILDAYVNNILDAYVNSVVFRLLGSSSIKLIYVFLKKKTEP